MRFILYFSIICQKLHSSAKNISANVSIKPYRCISRKRDIFSTVLLSRKCSISSVWRSSDSLEFIRRNRLSITSWRKIRYSPIPPSSLGEIYRSVFFKCHEPCLAELMHHFRCGRFADIYLSREHAEANRTGLRTVAANHLEIILLRRRESVFAPVFAAVESKKFFAAVHAHSPFSQMPILWYRETFFPRVNLY